VLVAGECGVWYEAVGVEMVEGHGIYAEEVMHMTRYREGLHWAGTDCWNEKSRVILCVKAEHVVRA
jgi:hypothetical protein